MKSYFFSGLIVLATLSYASCVDKNGESDLSPEYPSDVAPSEIYPDPIGQGSAAKSFPSFYGGGKLAFPDAEGFASEVTGARSEDGREVYHVTNLDDAGAGSFRDAVSQPNRIIVFDVAGIIRLSSNVLVLGSNQTILGHTAPGDGVVLYGGRFSASGAKNLIVRYLRIRMGAGYPSQADACGISNGSDMIFDHCSFTWGKDENFSINGDGKGTRPQNITIQNSIIGQGLENHSCGGLIQTGETEGITLFRNLYIDNDSRNPKVKGLNQFVNNVVYNWRSTGYNMGGESEGPSETSIVSNYFVVGLGHGYRMVDDQVELQTFNSSLPFTGGNANFRTYWRGNYYDKNRNGLLDGNEMIWAEDCSGSPTFLDSPSNLHPVIRNQSDAENAYHWVVDNVGTSLPVRDEVDAYLVDELTSLGTKGTIIRNETNTTQFPLGGPGTINDGEKPLDTDGDGMPDDFEDYWRLDKNDPSDAIKIANNGYTNIENYAFSLEYPERYVL